MRSRQIAALSGVRQMLRMHTRIAHGHLLVEPATVRSAVERDLPVMVEAVRAAIDRLP